MKRHALSLLPAAALLPGPAAEAGVLERFTDLAPRAYYLDAVEWAVANGIAGGTGGGDTFSPGRPCTGREIVTLLWRAAGAPPAAGMPGDGPCDAAICWASGKGIVREGFAGRGPCCRADAVNYIWQALGRPGIRAPGGALPWLSDVNEKLGFPFEAAILWAACAGVTTGTGGGTTFSPWRACTRAEIVTFLYRAYAK